ncbi:MAG: aminotransferase class V-fold PLP-dependent enzyme, partial [Candidatus Margulisiibacteriota bacterium]
MAKSKPALYLDYNASAPLLEVAKTAMAQAANSDGNPSSAHAPGREARALIENAREHVAALAGVSPHHLIFTSGATESNNQVLLGTWLHHVQQKKPFRLIVSDIEHSSVRNTATFLKTLGAYVRRLPVGPEGVVHPSDLTAMLTEAPADLVSVMAVNNETGAIQPVADLAAIAHRHGARFHTDAVQSLGKVPM